MIDDLNQNFLEIERKHTNIRKLSLLVCLLVLIPFLHYSDFFKYIFNSGHLTESQESVLLVCDDGHWK